MSFRFLNNHKFTPFAHRGGSLENKENTLDAFEKCISIVLKESSLFMITFKRSESFISFLKTKSNLN